jgi:hypothetical protein
MNRKGCGRKRAYTFSLILAFILEGFTKTTSKERTNLILVVGILLRVLDYTFVTVNAIHFTHYIDFLMAQHVSTLLGLLQVIMFTILLNYNECPYFT